MIDVGDIFQVAVAVRDVAGVLTNPTTATLTITLPDGTTTAPTVPLPPAVTGTLRVDYATVQAGLHRWRLTTTGPVTAYADAFNVVDASWPALVGLAEVKDHLNIPATDTTDDEELRGFIASAGAVVEDIVGVCGQRTIVETNSGGEGYIALSKRPVISITSVVIDGHTVDSGDYTASPSGLLAHRTTCWPAGFHNITTTYVAGRPVIEPNVIDGVKDLIRINWRPQAGGNYGAFDGGQLDDFAAAQETGLMQGQLRLGFFVPNTVTQRLQPDRRGPIVL